MIYLVKAYRDYERHDYDAMIIRLVEAESQDEALQKFCLALQVNIAVNHKIVVENQPWWPLCGYYEVSEIIK